MLKDQLNADVKTAMLAGDKLKVEVLKSLKSAILYEEVAKKVRDTGLPDDQILVVFAREAKKRGESAEMYDKGDRPESAAIERQEKAIIEEYLPKQLGDEELGAVVQQAIDAAGPNAQFGQIMGAVKAKVGQQADGARIAAIVKEKLGG